MELRLGYKQTEVGVIPEKWEVKRLGEIAELTSSKRIFEHEYVSGGIPFYRGKEISLLIDKKSIVDEYFIAESRYNHIRREFGAPSKGDILVTAVGTLGNVYVVPDDSKFYFKDGNLIWLRNIDRANSYYVAAQVRHKKSEIINSAIGSSQKALTIVVLKDVQIPLPPPPEQQAIAAALSDVDALISALDNLMAKKRDIKQAAMQQLLTGKTRLPGFSGAWEVKKLGEILDYEQPVKYLVKDTDYSDNNDIPVLTAGKTFILGYTDEQEGIYKNLPVIIFDDFTTASRYVDFPFKVKSSAIKLLKAKNEDADLRFIAEKIRTTKFALGDHKRYYISEYQHIEVDIPSPEEQTAIVTILSDMDAEIAALERKRDKTRALKQGMMQELLTGKTRLL